MQIVINMPEEVLNSIKTFKGKFICENGYDLIQGIKNGTPLPKGHGKIGDLDRLYNVFEKNVVSAGVFKELFDHAPTIIDADEVKE